MLTITSISPSTTQAGDMVVISGTDFDIVDLVVHFDDVVVTDSVQVVDDSTAVVHVPSLSLDTYNVYVSDGVSGAKKGPVTFTCSEYSSGVSSIPTIASVTSVDDEPLIVDQYNVVTVTGTGFLTTKQVYFYSDDLDAAPLGDFVIKSNTELEVVVPPVSGTVYLVVENSVGTSEPDDNAKISFIDDDLAELTSLSPSAGFAGDKVVITGLGFLEADTVLFSDDTEEGTFEADFEILSSSKIIATVPLGGEGTVSVYILNDSGESISYGEFTYGSDGAKVLRTSVSVSDGGSISPTPGLIWTVSASLSVDVTLEADYYNSDDDEVESIWYSLDGALPSQYDEPFEVSGAGSHRLTYWAVGTDGAKEAPNEAYLNLVATKTPSVTSKPSIGFVMFEWAPIAIPGIRYMVYVDTNNPPTTLVSTTVNNYYLHQMKSTDTKVYCRVRILEAGGYVGPYSTVTPSTASVPVPDDDLPTFETYFKSADSSGDPDAPDGLTVTPIPRALLVRWELPSEALWRTWIIEVHDSDEFDSLVISVDTASIVNSVPVDPDGGPYYVRVKAVNSRDEDSDWTEDTTPYTIPSVDVDWDEMPEITETMIGDNSISTGKIQSEAVTAEKIDAESIAADLINAEYINALELSAEAITTGTLSTERLNVGDILSSEITAANITGGNIEGVTITGSKLATSNSPAARVEIDSAAANQIRFYSGNVIETANAQIYSGVTVAGDVVIPYLNFRSPAVGVGAGTYGTMSMTPERFSLSAGNNKLAGIINVGDAPSDVLELGGLKVVVGNLWAMGGGIYQNKQMEPGDLHPPSLSMIRVVDLSVANNTITYVTMRKDATVEWDTHGFWDGEVNNAGPVIGMQGIYLIEVAVEWAAKASGWREVGIGINGSILVNNRTISPGNILCPMTISAVAELKPSDLVQIEVRHSGTGGALQLNAKTYTPRLQLTWLRHRPAYGVATSPFVADPYPGEYVS